ncbi:hypothetical protein Vretifemale_10958 [Volvox reticuliferus]|uniref:FAD synthase n=1 Tax=Volvox reticuliferus TaxID=1737510 RepID=A0A8J4CNM6_9CHLO|nr:hypothetical protein Vretifemale_10958 [Volvox reticuliferus]
MLPGRCVVLGCQRRLSPHSTASSHLAFGGIVATNRTSHWDPCCYGPAHVFGSGSLAALATGPSTLMPTAGTSLSPGVEVNSLGAATSLCGPFRAASTIISSSCRATSTSCGNRWPGNVRVRACCCGTVRSVLTNADESPPTCSSSSSSGARSKEKCNGDSVSVSSSSSNSTGNGSSGSCCSGSSIDSNGSRANGRKTGDTTAATATVMRGASGSCTRELVEDTTPENWLTPFVRPGSVVALGKFDALHKGHRALAATAAALAREIHASSSTCDTDTNHQLEAAGTCGVGTTADVGDAILLSFSGMATVLGWPDRLPLTAPQDRGRVLWGWAAACSAGAGTDTNSNDGRGSDAEVLVELAPPPPESSSTSSGAERRMAGARLGGPAGAVLSPRLRTLPFSLIRGMSPEQFVALLAHDLGAAGVVAGRNYRFGEWHEEWREVDFAVR